MTGRIDGGPETAGGFRPDASGGRWRLEGRLTVAEAGAVLAASRSLPLPAQGEVDLARIGAFDSAAVAVLLALRRRAAAEGAALAFTAMPERLEALARLYGVEGLLTGP
jgi:phospholipid transport system transporter-binding protein